MCYGYSPEDSDDGASRTSAPRSATRAPSSGEWPADSDAAIATPEPAQVNLDAPPTDSSEPLPEFQGGAEDEWDGGF